MPLGYSHSSAKLITQLMDARKNGSLGKWSKILWLACRAVISRAVISRRVADISKKKRLHRCTPPYSVLKSSLGPIFNFQVFLGGKHRQSNFGHILTTCRGEFWSAGSSGEVLPRFPHPHLPTSLCAGNSKMTGDWGLLGMALPWDGGFTMQFQWDLLQWVHQKLPNF